MKSSRILITLLALAVALLTSCSKEALEVLPGTWSTSDGGSITFSSDGTGSAINTDYFLNNPFGERITDMEGNPVNSFYWDLTPSGDTGNENLRVEFVDLDGSVIMSMEQPILKKKKDYVKIGIPSLGGLFGDDFTNLAEANQIELTR